MSRSQGVDGTSSGRRVVITGAGGRIGRAITPLLSATWQLVGTDVHPSDEVTAMDVTDLDACRAAFAGVDAVVHLAAVTDPGASFDQLLPANILGIHCVAQAAADAAVRRLVLASSLHAVSAAAQETQRRAGDAARPANLYGASKAWAEAVGSWLAATTTVSVVALRIGHFAARRPDLSMLSSRSAVAWLSARDAAELVRAAVEADVDGFVVVNGVSANRHRAAETTSATALLGYQPVDDAWAAQD